MDAKQLDHQVALITGAAGAIGRAIAYGFAEQGARLCLLDIDRARQDQLAGALKAKFGKDNILDIVGDVRDSETAAKCVEETNKRFGRLDILVNNAAITRIKKIDEITDEHIDEVIDTDLKGYFYFAREFVKLAKKNKTEGAILIISSKNGLEGASEKSLYSAVKGGGITMARALARELGPLGIRVNTICPDAVHEGSKLWGRGGHYSVATAKRYGISEDDIPEYYRQRCVLKVNIKPKDVANAAIFLCSNQSAKITGAVLSVDGGVAFVR